MLITSMMVLALCCGQTEQQTSPLVACVVPDKVYWQGEVDMHGILRLYSVPLSGPVALQRHSYGLEWNSNRAISWSIYKDNVWALVNRIDQPIWSVYSLAMASRFAGVPRQYRWDEHTVSRCPPLEQAGNSLQDRAIVDVYFDYVPLGDGNGKLFALTGDGAMATWELTLLPVKEPLPFQRQHEAKWKETRSYSVDFLEPFQVFLTQQGPVAITASGQLYTAHAPSEEGVPPTFKVQSGGKIIAVIDDQRHGETYAFTSDSCFSLSKPEKRISFKLPALGDGAEEVGTTLRHAIEFLDARK